MWLITGGEAYSVRRILLVLLVAALAAAGLWVLSELEGSPGNNPSPQPPPTAARATLAPDGQSVHYDNPDLFVSALLPGGDWTQDASSTADSSIYRSDKQSLRFGVVATGQGAPGSDEELSNHATSFVQANLTGYTVDQSSFQNLDAYRVEGIGTKGPFAGYHCVGYLYGLHDHEYLVWVGAQIAVWDASHRSVIGRILDSVQLR